MESETRARGRERERERWPMVEQLLVSLTFWAGTG